MTDFEYFIAFFSVMAGLIVAELAVKFADAIDSHPRRPIGLLTPLLAVFLLLDVTNFWLLVWGIRAVILVQWSTICGSVIVSVGYFLSAALVFPRSASSAESLDEHYFQRKGLVLAGVTLANVMIFALLFSIRMPAWNDGWAWFWLGVYFVPLACLWIVKSRKANILVLVILIIQYLAQSLPVPQSQWGNLIGINGSATNASAAPTTEPK